MGEDAEDKGPSAGETADDDAPDEIVAVRCMAENGSAKASAIHPSGLITCSAARAETVAAHAVSMRLALPLAPLPGIGAMPSNNVFRALFRQHLIP
jgi:hypothetical protein